MSIQEVLKDLKKNYGSDAIIDMSLGMNTEVPKLKTQSLNLNSVLDGGIPLGRIIEIYGDFGTGKTSLVSFIAGEFQKNTFGDRTGRILFVDSENALDRDYAMSFGFDTMNMYLVQPSCGEQALNIMSDSIESGEFDLIICDSVAALSPRAEIEGDVEDALVGVQARMMSKGLRKINAQLFSKNTTVIFTNQTRNKIMSYGNPETTPGGKALNFYSSLRIRMNAGEYKTDKEKTIGYLSKLKVTKNKTGIPHKSTQMMILFNQGYDFSQEFIDAAIEAKLIDKKGAGWYTIVYENNEYKLQGDHNVKTFFEENPDIRDYFKEQMNAN